MTGPAPLASAEGREALSDLRRANTLYAFDYDGTLAPFANDPAKAFMDPVTADALKTLVAARPVAVITGRSLETLLQLLPVRPPFLVGNHGVEGVGWDVASLERCRAVVRDWHPKLREALANRRDLRLEDKVYSMTAHFRGSPDEAGARAAVMEAIAQLDPIPRAIGGVDVVNLVPPGAPHKGTALEKLLRDHRFERALYVGDDLTDEDVFRHVGPEVLTIRVACRPAPTAARFFTTLPEMAAFLRELAH